MRDDRARITIVEILMSLFAMAFLGALWPVVSDSLDAAVSEMSVGVVYLMQLILPLMLLVLLSTVYATAGEGG